MGLTDWEPEFGDFLNSVHKVYPKNWDINSGDPLGAGVCQVSAHNRHRTTASGAYLSDISSNVDIITGKTAVQIIFDHGKAIGVLTDVGLRCKTGLSYHELPYCC